MAKVYMPGRWVWNLNNQERKCTYECCEWYGCALACVPVPACGEQSYPHNGSQHWNEKKCWMNNVGEIIKLCLDIIQCSYISNLNQSIFVHTIY